MSMAVKNCADNYEHLTADQMYVEGNIPGPGVDLEEFESEFAVGCSCQTQCLTTLCSCTQGTPNYYNGCLVENKAGPIIECNSHCTCRENCGNRLVQMGPLNCLSIVESGGRGLGLSTSRSIRKGQFICEYAGEVIGVEEAERRFEKNKKSMNYVIVVSEYIGEKKVITCIDPQYFGNIGRYCNHSCEPNTCLIPVRVEKNSPRVCLFARKDIKPGEEITFHYAEGVDIAVHNLSQTPCLCGSITCQNYLPHHSL